MQVRLRNQINSGPRTGGTGGRTRRPRGSGRLAAAALEMAGPNPTRANMLRLINDVGRFDISGNIITFGQQANEAPAKVFLTVIQPDGTFKAVDKL